MIATSYTQAIEVLRARVGELGMRYQDFDELAGFPAGLTGKVFGPSMVKRLGPEKLFDALSACGLRIRFEEDPEQTAKMQARIAENFNPRQENQARPGNSASPISTALRDRVYGHFLKVARKSRWAKTTKKERSEHARMMAMARVRKERKRRKAANSRKQRLRLEGKAP